MCELSVGITQTARCVAGTVVQGDLGRIGLGVLRESEYFVGQFRSDLDFGIRGASFVRKRVKNAEIG